MNLKHANFIQKDILLNKKKRESEEFKYAEERLFENILENQSKGEDRTISLRELSKETIDKLKALDYVIYKDSFGFTIVDWGSDRHARAKRII